MPNLDETLQNQLAALENGVPLEQVLENLPADARELIPLIQLAVATQKLPHPQLRAEIVREQKARVVAAVRTRNTLPQPLRWLSNQMSRFSPVRVVAGLAALAIVTIGVGFYTAGPASAHYVSLTNVSGMVEVTSSQLSDDWHFVSGNEKLQKGERIRTYADSQASLVFFDGSRTQIGPESEVVVSDLNGNWGNTLQVKLTQKVGMTSHAVVPLRGNGSFIVDTPSGQASVHGTNFDVAVNPDGQAVFAVTHGEVQVQNASAEADLNSGQATKVLPGQNSIQLAYQFRLVGSISHIQDGLWTVNGVEITLTTQTSIVGTFVEGDEVIVQGRVVSGDQWIADEIEPAGKKPDKAQFTGTIDAMPGVPGTWVISGQQVTVDSETELSGQLGVSSAVRVTFVVLPDNGGWLAKEIESLDGEEEKPTDPPEVEPSDTATPGEDTDTSTPTDTTTPDASKPTATVMPKNDTNRCENRTEEQPKAVKLAQTYNVDTAAIMEWFCKGFGFGEIDLAYELSISTGKPVSEIFALRSSGLGWGQIKKQLSENATPVPPKKSTPPGNSGDHGNNGSNGQKPDNPPGSKK